MLKGHPVRRCECNIRLSRVKKSDNPVHILINGLAPQKNDDTTSGLERGRLSRSDRWGYIQVRTSFKGYQRNVVQLQSMGNARRSEGPYPIHARIEILEYRFPTI